MSSVSARDTSMNFLVSSRIDLGVAVKTGGGCGGFRSFQGAIVEVVIGLVAERELQGIAGLEGRVCAMRAERRVVI